MRNKEVFKIGNKKSMVGLLIGDWKGYHKRDGKFYPVECTYTAYIPDLGVNIFSLTRALTKGFNVTSEKEILVLKKNATTLKLEERLDYGNSEGYLLAARLHTSPHDARKMN